MLGLFSIFVPQSFHFGETERPYEQLSPVNKASGGPKERPKMVFDRPKTKSLNGLCRKNSCFHEDFRPDLRQKN